MFEARVAHGALWKKLIEALKDLVSEANFNCSPGGTSIQAMDQSHVALVNLLLRADGFEMYNCERNSILGLNLTSLSKILKATDSTDTITLRHEDDADVLTILSENSEGTKSSEFQLKLMEIEAESMGIPELEYKAKVSMPSAEFAKACRDMAIFGDTVTIDLSREGVKFSAAGDVGEATALLKASGKADEKVKPEVKAEKVKKEKKEGVKSETKTEVKAEKDDEDVTIAEKAAARKSSSSNANKPSADKDDDNVASDGVYVTLQEPVNLSFALRFMNTFAKGAALSDRVELHMAKDSPCMVEYKIEGLGFLRYYLAPKVDEGEQTA